MSQFGTAPPMLRSQFRQALERHRCMEEERTEMDRSARECLRTVSHEYEVLRHVHNPEGDSYKRLCLKRDRAYSR